MISYFINSIEPNKDKKNRLQSKNDSNLYFEPFFYKQFSLNGAKHPYSFPTAGMLNNSNDDLKSVSLHSQMTNYRLQTSY